MDVAQFSYNLQQSEATGKSPFELVMGQQPTTPHTLQISFSKGQSPAATKMAKSWSEHMDLARVHLEKAQRRMKKWADAKRRVGKVSYRLDLPNTLKIHPVFHVSMLKPYYPDEEDTSRGDSHRAPPVVTTSFDKDVEEVLAKRIERRRGVQPSTQYLIKWKGFPESEATWETKHDLWQFKELLHQFEATRASAK
ncbi:uncharacterized protein [Henckelia pumila]|uniref:uncharacterized protein n=1 Tax=Henckelia pumila TaxID=405737 RepID=UPI003C6E1500